MGWFRSSSSDTATPVAQAPAPDALLTATKLASTSQDPTGLAARRRAMASATTALQLFVQGLRSPEAEERTESCRRFARWAQNAFGLEAEALGAEMRRSGSLSFVLRLLYEPDRTQQCVGLMLLGNLTCSSFDPKSPETCKLVLKADVFSRVKQLIFSSDEVSEPLLSIVHLSSSQLLSSSSSGCTV